MFLLRVAFAQTCYWGVGRRHNPAGKWSRVAGNSSCASNARQNYLPFGAPMLLIHMCSKLGLYMRALQTMAVAQKEAMIIYEVLQ